MIVSQDKDGFYEQLTYPLNPVRLLCKKNMSEVVSARSVATLNPNAV